MFKSVIIIPTLNAGEEFEQVLVSISSQSYQPDRKIIIDSESVDRTVDLAMKYGFEVVPIARGEFNHGLTRQQGVDSAKDADIVIFITQDAILANAQSLEKLMECFVDPVVGAAYGRQLPRINAMPIEAHARLFNYPAASLTKTMADAPRLGIKTAFLSNSFAAYRRSALISIGGFPANTIFGEDTYAAAKMLLAGMKVRYCAEAQVYHSHNYGFIQEFKRHFDIGVFRARESWMRDRFGSAEGEGFRFVASEIKYLWSNNGQPYIPAALIRTFLKYVGYRLGLMERVIPVNMKKHLTMNQQYWQQN